ncbi:MAG: oxygenase MpaB family protein [Polyangia bacterium]
MSAGENVKVVPEWPTRFCGLEAARRRFGDRVDRLAPYLLAGDPFADRAVDALPPGRAGHALIGAALDGETSVPRALADLVEAVSVVPPWVEWERIDRGGRFFLRTGLVGGIVLGARALVMSYSSPGGNKPLAFSGRLTENAAPRLNETARFVRAVVRPAGMRVGGEGWKLTLRVRLIHAQIRRMLAASPRWRRDEWGAPINQHDMVAASLVFSVVTLGGVRRLGIDVSESDSDDFMHLWRWVSHVIGVDPALFPVTETEAVRLSDLIGATQAAPDDDSRALTQALLEHGIGHPDLDTRELAQRTLGAARAVCRHLVGDAVADGLRIPKTRERFLVPAVVATVRALEQARKRSPRLEQLLVDRGLRYWDRVIDQGLVYATRDFELPSALGSRA